MSSPNLRRQSQPESRYRAYLMVPALLHFGPNCRAPFVLHCENHAHEGERTTVKWHHVSGMALATGVWAMP